MIWHDTSVQKIGGVYETYEKWSDWKWSPECIPCPCTFWLIEIHGFPWLSMAFFCWIPWHSRQKQREFHDFPWPSSSRNVQTVLQHEVGIARWENQGSENIFKNIFMYPLLYWHFSITFKDFTKKMRNSMIFAPLKYRFWNSMVFTTRGDPGITFQTSIISEKYPGNDHVCITTINWF